MPKRLGNNIDKLFKNRLKNAEVVPQNDIWENISTQINNTPSSSLNNKLFKGGFVIVCIFLVTFILFYTSFKFTNIENAVSENIYDNLDNTNNKSSFKENFENCNTWNEEKNNYLIIDGFDKETFNNVELLKKQKAVQKKSKSKNRTKENSNKTFVSDFTSQQNQVINHKAESQNSNTVKVVAHNEILFSDKQLSKNVKNKSNEDLFKNKKKFFDLIDKKDEIDNLKIDVTLIEEERYSFNELKILQSIPISDVEYTLNNNFLKERFFKKKQKNKPEFYIGLIYQYNRAWQNNILSQNFLHNIEAEIENEAIWGDAYGFSLNYITPNNWEIETQFILNSSLGGKFNMSYVELDEVKETSQNIEYSYFQLPILFKKRIALTRNHKLNLGLISGIQFSRLQKEANSEYALNNTTDNFVRDNELGFVGGLEIDYKIAKNISIRVGSKITASNKYGSVLQFHNNKGTDAYNLQAGFTSGLVFRLF